MHGNTGRKHSEETKLKISESLKGSKHSTETKLKISKATRGDKHPNWKVYKSKCPCGGKSILKTD